MLAALSEVKWSRLINPGFRSVMQPDMPLADFTYTQNQQAILACIEHSFQFPTQLFYLPARQPAPKD